ncbi:MAG: rhomboid family intramembrane serine protease [Haloferacaceae archaeon]
MSDRPTPPSRDRLRSYPARVRARARETDWRLTFGLVALSTAAYLGQTLAALRVGAPVRVVTARLFLARPLVAWPLSPFLHGGNPHFLANVLVLVPTGIEAQRHLTDRQYAGLFVVTAVVAALLAAATLVPFADGPVASYGISGFVFALATYLLVHLRRAHPDPPFTARGVALDRHPLELFGALLGVSVLLLVAADLGLALRYGLRGVNGGHLGGAAVGAVAGALHRGPCADADRQPE